MRIRIVLLCTTADDTHRLRLNPGVAASLCAVRCKAMAILTASSDAPLKVVALMVDFFSMKFGLGFHLFFLSHSTK
jgi:hypothetical protein